MVGVRKSNRCDNCRIRKKKCDEKLPSCSECIRTGWKCPGYKSTKPWKFVDEVPKLVDQYADRKYVYNTVSSDSDEVLSGDSDEDSELNGIIVWRRMQMQTKSEIPRYPEINHLAPAFIFCLDSKVREPLVPLRMSGSIFDFVPARIGHNIALDSAVACMSAIYRCTPSISYIADREIYQSYVKALASLRSCLNDSSLRFEAETLCASIMLQMCELVVSTGRGDWGNLARGTSILLSTRGVKRYSSAFEQAMLESQLPYVFGQSLKFKEHCFLSSPEWQCVLQQTSNWPYQSTQASSLALRTRLLTSLADMPSLVIYHAEVNAEEMYHQDRKERTDILISKATTMLNDAKNWLTFGAEPLFLSYSVSTQGLHEHISYPDVLSAVLDCVANTALVTIDKILRSLCKSRMFSSILLGEDFDANEQFDRPETVEGWRQRAKSAFRYVEGKSSIVAKPLDFGVRQIQAGNPEDLIANLEIREGPLS